VEVHISEVGVDVITIPATNHTELYSTIWHNMTVHKTG